MVDVLDKEICEEMVMVEALDEELVYPMDVAMRKQEDLEGLVFETTNFSVSKVGHIGGAELMVTKCIWNPPMRTWTGTMGPPSQPIAEKGPGA